MYFRNYLYNYIKKYKETLIIEYPYLIYNDTIIDFETYINNINKNAFFAGILELKITSDIFNINIIAFKYINKYNGYIHQYKYLKMIIQIL